VYSPDSGTTWHHLQVSEGSYDITDISSVIEQKINQNAHTSGVKIPANTNTLKAVLILENGFQVDFRYERSLNSVLGFNEAVYTSDYQESGNPVDILSINSILVNVNIISRSCVNGQRNPTIYSFFPAVIRGYKIIETPANLVYLAVTLDAIYSMETSLTDQNGKLFNLRGENISFRFHVREI